MEPHGPEISEMRNLAERSRWLLDELREKSAAASARRREQLEHFGSDATELIEQVAAQIAKELAEDLTSQFNEDRSEQLRAIESEREALTQQRSEWESQRDEWESVRVQIEQELTEREARLLAREGETQPADGAGASPELQAELDHARSESHRYASELEAAAARIAELQSHADAFAEAEGKLEIALGDLQHQREQVAALEEQLATRPTEEGAGSQELARLRQERDELEEQLRQALASPASGGEGDGSDLQRRFEMAVEDLRQLKQENADLQEKIASGAGATGASDEGGDWEAQKRKLLASLAGEEPTEEPQRQEEIAQINATIQITDGVVAEKDAEIQQLREQLENAAHGSAEPSEEEAQQREALLDSDEVIQAERQRLVDLEKEWEEKLRTAELELSVERAKIARSQTEMAEQLQELEAYRKKYNNEFGDKSGGGRNWFNQLGLGSDNSDE